jgi:hypothetical protein
MDRKKWSLMDNTVARHISYYRFFYRLIMPGQGAEAPEARHLR